MLFERSGLTRVAWSERKGDVFVGLLAAALARDVIAAGSSAGADHAVGTVDV